MVKIRQKQSPGNDPVKWKTYLPGGVLFLLTLVLLRHVLEEDHVPNQASAIHNLHAGKGESEGARDSSIANAVKAQLDQENGSNAIKDQTATLSQQCPYQKLADLTPEEQHPLKGPRHMVTPPEGGNLHLVCCHTTKGPLNFVIHEKWAPHGAQRVLQMVKTAYFNAGVPMMRCLRGFLCQFGLNSDKNLSQLYRKTLPDDPNWLPEGPTNRRNKDGVVRFAHGYMAYAGGGKDTRDNQLIVSLENVETLAGGSPWEVPWGELVGSHSFETLGKLYTGYGENGPPQGKLWNRGMTEEMKQEFPDLDYINECAVVDERIES